MEEKVLEKNQEVEIDLKRLFGALMKKAWLIAIVSVLCAVISLVGTVMFITPQYRSSIMFYVNNSAGATDGLSSSDITASRNLVKSYLVILDTKETLQQVVDRTGLDYTYKQIQSMISADAVDSTEIIKITVTTEDPEEAALIANALAEIVPNQITSIIEGTSARIVETAEVATHPSSPSKTKNTIIGFLVGFVFIAGAIVLHELFDITIRTEEDISSQTSLPVLASVPDMDIGGKGSPAAVRKPGEKMLPQSQNVGGNLSFAAAEAYKLLRTKLQFSFVDSASCRIIGVSSAMVSEGKSLTSVNLAYSLSQLGKRVLLMDCDLRRPSIVEKLPVKSTPGLSDYLSGQVRGDNLIQPCGLKNDICAFHVISAGSIPPNPMELLSSNKMERMLDTLKENYDYIIMDLPPVGEVGDALATAKMTNGVLLVVRQGYCNRLALRDAIRQFEFVESRLLGIVINRSNDDSNGYSKKYYKKYGYGYRKGYYRSYGNTPAADRKTKG